MMSHKKQEKGDHSMYNQIKIIGLSIVAGILMLGGTACKDTDDTIAPGTTASAVPSAKTAAPSNTEKPEQTASASETPETSASPVPTVHSANMHTQQDGTFRLPYPADWKKASESGNITIYVSEQYPAVKENMNITVSEKDSVFDSYTKEILSQLYESTFENVKEFTFDRLSVSGFPAIRISFRTSMEGVSLKNYTYMINGTTWMCSVVFTEFDTDLSDVVAMCIDGFEAIK